MIFFPSRKSGNKMSGIRQMENNNNKNWNAVRNALCDVASKDVLRWKRQNIDRGIVKLAAHQIASILRKDKFEKCYKLHPKPLATGSFASVYSCECISSGKTYAAKFSSRQRYGEDCTNDIYHEVAVLACCNFDRIVALHDLFQTASHIIIVAEYAPGGDLQRVIDENMVPYEEDVVRFTWQITEMLAYLHANKIAHLDIKPQNLVMMEDYPRCDIKLCDFEISRVILDGSQIREILGTPDYVAPEILHYEPISLASDMWSLGVTVYVLLTGFSPFGGESDQETFANISRAQVDFPTELFDEISSEAIDFIKQLLIRDPTKRLTAKQCLRHPWLINFENQIRKSTPAKESTCNTATTTGNGRPSLDARLSKSREKLFEKLVSHRATLENEALFIKYEKTRRMCESQMCLVSKYKEPSADPMINRSRDKLYGVKSLSKSQDMIDFCKSLREFTIFQMGNGENNIRPNLIRAESEQPKTDENEGDLAPVNCKSNLPAMKMANRGYTFSKIKPIFEHDKIVIAAQNNPNSTNGLNGTQDILPNTANASVLQEIIEEPRYTVAQLISAFETSSSVASEDDGNANVDAFSNICDHIRCNYCHKKNGGNGNASNMNGKFDASCVQYRLRNQSEVGI